MITDNFSLHQAEKILWLGIGICLCGLFLTDVAPLYLFQNYIKYNFGKKCKTFVFMLILISFLYLQGIQHDFRTQRPINNFLLELFL